MTLSNFVHNNYTNNLSYIPQRAISLLLLFLLSPLLLLLLIVIKLTSKGPAIYRQERIGMNKKVFTIYKLRTMVDNAESIKNKLIDKNELAWPLFKIKNDPRHTLIGKYLIRFGLDELPQLINILKGEMAFVGPRPFPVEEAKKISSKFDERYNVLPGLTAPWVIKGFHSLSLKEWMELDCLYAKTRSMPTDIFVIWKTILLLLRQ